MAPPPPRPKSKGINALDEDTFVEAIGEIIERDFFPDLPKLHRQIKWLEGLEARGRASATEVSGEESSRPARCPRKITLVTVGLPVGLDVLKT